MRPRIALTIWWESAGREKPQRYCVNFYER